MRLPGLRVLGALLVFAAYLALAHYFQSDPTAIVGGGVAGHG